MSDNRSLLFPQRAYEQFQEAMNNLKTVEDEFASRPLEKIEAYCEPLSIETRKEVKVLLSWGGVREASLGFRGAAPPPILFCRAPRLH